MHNKKSNWGSYHRWHPRVILRPKSKEELCEIVRKAAQEKKKIRVVGACHSMNELCATQAIQIETHQLCNILNLNTDKSEVTVEAGITIRAFLHELAAHNLTLPNQGYIVDQSLAGAIGTATHGSGKTGTLSSFVKEIQLIDGRGELRTLSSEKDPHLFSAAVVHLGCLGIIYAITLRCAPLRKLHLRKRSVGADELIHKAPQLLEEHAYFQYMINPYADQAVWFQYTPSNDSVQHRWAYRLRWGVSKVLATLFFDVLPSPWWSMPALMCLYFWISRVRSCTDYSYRLLSPADEGHYIETEIAVPMRYYNEAIDTVRTVLNKHSRKKSRLVALLLVRFANADEQGYLSPSYREDVVYISLITIAKAGYKDLFNEVETALYTYQGRPHWGKVHFLDTKTIQHLYGERFELFLQAREELDPKGLFMNEYLQRLLLP